MTIFEIKKIAQEQGIDYSNKSIEEIIQEIQIKEKNVPCFISNKCNQLDCCWRGNCSRAMIVPIVHGFNVI